MAMSATVSRGRLEHRGDHRRFYRSSTTHDLPSTRPRRFPSPVQPATCTPRYHPHLPCRAYMYLTASHRPPSRVPTCGAARHGMNPRHGTYTCTEPRKGMKGDESERDSLALLLHTLHTTSKADDMLGRGRHCCTALHSPPSSSAEGLHNTYPASDIAQSHTRMHQKVANRVYWSTTCSRQTLPLGLPNKRLDLPPAVLATAAGAAKMRLHAQIPLYQ